MQTSAAPQIKDYFAIGNLRTVALVSDQGSIDWLCLPYFDSPSIFGKILDPKAGHFALDMPDYKFNVAYLPNSAIVSFTLANSQSKLVIHDYMVPKDTSRIGKQQLVRRVTGVRGESVVRFDYNPCPDYGHKSAQIKIEGGKLQLPFEQGTLVLHVPRGSSFELTGTGYKLAVPVAAGQSKSIVVEFVPNGLKPSRSYKDTWQKTNRFWSEWVAQGTYFAPNRSMLIRSAITLKLMQFAPTGAIVAAPTTSLPETIGGVRNWDYRYVWIRDATFALYAFTVLGYKKESQRFFNFIETITAGCERADFDIALMYTIWGKPVPRERVLEHLNGYQDSRPVRIGNDAAGQFQLDVYGVLLDSIYFALKQEIKPTHRPKQSKLVMNLVHKIDALWEEPDSGIWEARVGPKHYTYSRVMAWVGAERAMQLCRQLKLSDDDTALCARLEATIRDWIWNNCFSKSDNILQQYPGSQTVDATNLLFVLVKFLDKHDPITKEIVDNTVDKLLRDGCFVQRYDPSHDGLPGKEGSFILCTFWLISALAILEEVDRAAALFKKFTSILSPHGLFPEEIDPVTEIYLGNYPQAFSHMGYIMSAHYLHKYSNR